MITLPTSQKAAWEGSPGTVKVAGAHRARPHPDHPAPAGRFDGDVGAGRRQHLLGVGPGGHRLAHHGLPLGRQTGQQHGRLDLGAGHRGCELDAAQPSAGDGQGGKAAVGQTPHLGAHPTEGFGHPVHRSPLQ